MQLLPLAPEHHDGLCEAVRDGRLWELWYTQIPAPEQMRDEIDRRLALEAVGSMMPFTVFDRTGRIVGMTTLMHVDRSVPRVEIGSTWYAHRVQRSAINTEAKLLLLTQAFDVLDCAVVELRTHALNRQSRSAIERLGARFDGLLRHHARMPNGTLRDTAVYSILAAEWPATKAHLQWQLARPRRQTAP